MSVNVVWLIKICCFQVSLCGQLPAPAGYSNILDIACEQVTASNCPDRKWTVECPKETQAGGVHQSKVPSDVKTDICARYLQLDKNSLESTLHKACKDGKLKVVKCILSQGKTDINCRGRWGKTPVMVAVRNGREALFHFLVLQGSDLSSVDDNKENLLHAACRGGKTEIVQKLLDDLKFDTEGEDFRGRTPIMFAVYFGKKDVFDLLANRGCNLKTVDSAKNNILHMASMGGVDMMRHIIKLNIFDIDSRGQNWQTPLMHAVEMGKRSIVELLLNKGSNLTLKDKKQNNVLHLACIAGRVTMVKYLITLKKVEGMDKEKNSYDLTPVQVAQTMGYPTLVRILGGES